MCADGRVLDPLAKGWTERLLCAFDLESTDLLWYNLNLKRALRPDTV